MYKKETERSILISVCAIIALVIAVLAAMGVMRASASFGASLNEASDLADQLAKMSFEVVDQSSTSYGDQVIVPTKKEDPTDEVVVPEDELEDQGLVDGVYTGSGKGYGGTITLKMTVKEGAISKLVALSR